MFGCCTTLVLWLTQVQPSTVLAPPHTTVGADAARVFHTVGGAILYCDTPPYTTVGTDAARFFVYGWRRDPLLCYPPLHHCWCRCRPFFIRGAARSSTVLPPPTLLSGQMPPVFFIRLAARSCTVLPPYTAPGLNAACFGAMSVGVLGEPSLGYPPTLHLGQMLPVLVR